MERESQLAKRNEQPVYTRRAFSRLVAASIAGVGVYGVKHLFDHPEEITPTFTVSAEDVTLSQPQATPTREVPPRAVQPEIAPSGELSVEPVNGHQSLSAENVQTILARNDSPAALEEGLAEAFYDYGQEYEIDDAVELAFFYHESQFGTQGVARETKSIGNIRYTGDDEYPNYQGYKKYPNFKKGLEDFCRLIKRLYKDTWHKDTVEKIIPTYAPSADNNNPSAYIKGVRDLVFKWRAEFGAHV